MMNKNLKKIVYAILPLISIGAFFIAWIILSSAEGTLIPTPKATFFRLIEILVKPISGGTLFVHIWVSLRRVLIAFVIAIFLGVGLGVGLG